MNSKRRQETVWLTWVGEMSALAKFLKHKSWNSSWAVPKGASAILRSIGVVAFANNPITGFLILIAMFVNDSNVAMASILAGFIGLLVSKVLRREEALIVDGVPMLNNVLTGCIAVAVFPTLSGHPLDTNFWIFLSVTFVLGSYVDTGLNSLMMPCKLPALSIPFNVIASLLYLSLHSKMQGTTEGSVFVHNETHFQNETQEVDWYKVWEGTVLSVGQVYGVGTMDSSILIWLGFIFCSPLLSLFFYAGSVIGSCLAILFNPLAAEEVYIGLWGYNSLLTTGCIGYFMTPSPGIVMATIVAGVLAVLFQLAMNPLFLYTTLPVMSYPFNVASLLVLALCTSENGPYSLVENKTIPEKHLWQRYSPSRAKVPLGLEEAETPLGPYKETV